MGLDFTVYAKYKGTDADVKDVELAYGRKSWELVHFLKLDASQFDVPVWRENWNELMEALEVVGDHIDDIWDAFEIVEYAPDDFPEMIVTDEVKRLIATYEFWYNKTFGGTPTLGYDFSLGYIKNFWEAREEADYYFNHPETWEVRAEISY